MERASSELIAALLDAHSMTSPAGGRTQVRMARSHVRRCQCGRCPQCLENARWERIFAEKFADPAYYTRTITRTASPLSSL